MRSIGNAPGSSWALASLAAGLIVGGLLVGYQPVGGDPDTLYRPIKSELARSLTRGELPFWSDRLGVGVPLVAESHVAAFYPLNWISYRLLSVPLAYRLSMWLHYLGLIATTYCYGRILKITPSGSALAAIAFAFCGFQNIHACHEPFYHALVYLPLALCLAELYVASGRWLWAVLLALCWGVQLTLGHFQIQMWTAGLVVFIGLWRVIADRRPALRFVALVGALAWGAAIAAVQLLLTWEMVQVVHFERQTPSMVSFSFPPAHWAQLALPRLYMGLSEGLHAPYWIRQQTSEGEAALYVGTVPLILAFVVGTGDRKLTPWRWIAVGGFLLATMPRWCSLGYIWLMNVPGFGWFRAPGRYTLLTCLGLSLIAGRGLDRSWPARRFARSLVLAAVFGLLAGLWTIAWAGHSGLQAAIGEAEFHRRLIEAALIWATAVVVVGAWRRGWVGAWAPLVAAAAELGFLYYGGPVYWGWAPRLPEASPVLKRLLAEPDAGLVAGSVGDMPLQVGLAPAFPLLGIVPPPPNYLLLEPSSPTIAPHSTLRRRMRRFGVSHGIWVVGDKAALGETLYTGPDPALDVLIPRKASRPGHLTWQLVRYSDAFPSAHVALRAHEANTWQDMFARLSQADYPDESWYVRGEQPATGGEPWPRSARLVSWDGHSGLVEHDGTCDLVIRRAFYPGWTCRVNDGPEIPVAKVDNDLQVVRLYGSGPSRVSVAYRPTHFGVGAAVSACALGLACLMMVAECVRWRWSARLDRNQSLA